MNESKKSVMLILDGLGLNESEYGNASFNAMPFLGSLKNSRPFSKLKTHGGDVGLPAGAFGSSEVGHLNIGAGRVVYQEVAKIDSEIESDNFFNNKKLAEHILNAKAENKALHLVGLLSDGKVHSSLPHLFALLKLCRILDFKNVYVHAVTDGRDTLQKSAGKYLKELSGYIQKNNTGKIASVTGRFYAMDRDNRWERTRQFYDLLINGRGKRFDNFEECLEFNYKQQIYDEFIPPSKLKDFKEICGGDYIINFNFRADRARQLTLALCERAQNFDRFDKKDIGVKYLGFIKYLPDNYALSGCGHVFERQTLENSLIEYLSGLNLKTLKIAETEKYAHATYFFNALKEQPFPNEKRVLIDSPKVLSYDLKPEMSAYEICAEAESAIKNGDFDFILINFANCDMVGHTGNFEAAQRACKAVDACVKRIYDACAQSGYILIITADHGNAEEMLGKDGQILTQHSFNPVPFIVACGGLENLKLKANGRLCDVAPTALSLMGLDIPKEMTGLSLVKSSNK